MAAWGWSMGGYGSLRLAEVQAQLAEGGGGVQSRGGARMTGPSPGSIELAGQPLGVWCGTSDPLYQNVQQFVAALPQKPDPLSYGEGAHTRAYWDSVTLPAFAFIGEKLTPSG